MKFLVSALAICVMTLGLAACNTIDGAGQDIQAGGHAISKASDNVKHGN